jgi:hypothetical protein
LRRKKKIEIGEKHLSVLWLTVSSAKQLEKLFGVDWVNSAAVGNRTRNILKKRFGRFRRSWESNQEHFEKNPIFLTPPADGIRTENISIKTASSIGANPPEQTRLNGTGFAKVSRS